MQLDNGMQVEQIEQEEEDNKLLVEYSNKTIRKINRSIQNQTIKEAVATTFYFLKTEAIERLKVFAILRR